MSDLISRQAAINIIKNWLFNDTGYSCGEKNVMKCTINELRDLPSFTQKTGWIPVSERLPEDSELVLFSTKTDRVFEGRYFADNTDRQWYAFRDETFAWNNVVTAWMPLPQPYKEESEE